MSIDNSENAPRVPRVARCTGDEEWYTPAEYVEAARRAMGGIDVDPASCAVANRTVKAGTYFTKHQDGLKRRWHGRVWLNPPYSRGMVERFVDELVARYSAGETTTACVLVNNCTDTKWFHRLMSACSSLCLVKGRIRFVGRTNGSPAHGQAIIYLGDNPAAFEAEFQQYGAIVVRQTGQPNGTAQTRFVLRSKPAAQWQVLLARLPFARVGACETCDFRMAS